MKCPLCGREMSRMNQNMKSEKESLYYCERHGVLNKPSDLKDKADKISKKA